MAGTDRSKEGVRGGPSIVLVDAQMGENIGFAARAMLNGGLEDLRLVRPRDGWPNDRALVAASGAEAVIESARVFEDVRSAITGFERIFATTARLRGLIKIVATPRPAVQEMQDCMAGGGRVAVLFGPESRGLDNDEISLADTILSVPLNPVHSSMNLGHAVMVLAYEWFQAAHAEAAHAEAAHAEAAHGGGAIRALDAEELPAAKEELFKFFDRLEAELDACGFLHVTEKRPIMVRNIRSIFQRALPTSAEVRTLHGILSGLVRGRGPDGRDA